MGLTLTFGVLVKVSRELIVCFRTEWVIVEAVEMDTLLSVLLLKVSLGKTGRNSVKGSRDAAIDLSPVKLQAVT